MRDPRAADLDARDRALLEFADVLTRSPASMRREHLERLRHAGFDDGAILHAVEIVAYYNFVNRLADGLGVELEEHLRKSDER